MKYYIILLCLLISSIAWSQNVGIGTNLPTRAKLEVHGAMDATSAIFGGESTGISLQRNWPGIGFNSYYNAGNKSIGNGYGAKQYLDPTSGYFYLDIFSNANANTIPISSFRALTISPIRKISLLGAPTNAELQLPNTLDNRKIVLWESANNNHQFYGLGIESGSMRYSVSGAGNVHRFYAGTGPNSSNLLMSIWADRTVIIGDNNGGGKLGINLLGPTHTLSIKQAGNTGIYLQEAASGTSWEFRAQYFAPNDARSLMLRHDNVEIGFFRASADYVSYSDKRLKQNIEDMKPILEKILKLQPSRYELKANNHGHEKSIGFIAQQVNGLFPELVTTVSGKNDNGMTDMLGINYSGFGVIAIKAIQEQQKLITDLQAKVLMLAEQNKMMLQLLNAKK